MSVRHAQAAPAPPTKVICPPRGWRFVDVPELWRFRELVFFLVWRDVKVRYKQTLLGAAWAVLQPLMMMAVFSVFFGRMANVPTGGLPYPLFAFAGLLPWSFFATAITNGAASVVGSERLITKVYFPRLAVPFGAAGAAVVDFAIALGLLVVLMIGYAAAGYPVAPGFGLLLAPVVFLCLMMAAAGVGTLLAALNVVYRDVRYVLPFLVQLWMFATPTVYMQPDAAADSPLQALLALNPLTAQVAAFRASVLGGPIAWGSFGLSAACCALLFLAGCLYFRRVEDRFADII